LLTAGILAAALGLNWFLRNSPVTFEARLSLLVVVLLASLIPRSLPRTLTADGDQIRWKRTFQPPQTIARSDVSALLYLPSAGSGNPRFFFVGREGTALLWIDRFTPEQMTSFATYLGLSLRTVAAAPSKDPAAVQTVGAITVSGSRRSMVAAMAACVVGGTGLTAFMGAYGASERALLADYQRAPLCAAPAANPRACRFDTPAQVTGITAKGQAELRFRDPVPTLKYQTTTEGVVSAPDPAFSAGDTVQVEVFDGWLMAINGGRTSSYRTLEQNSSWWLIAAAAGLFIVAPGIGLVLAWRGPASWFVPRSGSTV
jgi:hypothetical protein